jgi:hypothetical protein
MSTTVAPAQGGKLHRNETLVMRALISISHTARSRGVESYYGKTERSTSRWVTSVGLDRELSQDTYTTTRKSTFRAVEKSGSMKSTKTCICELGEYILPEEDSAPLGCRAARASVPWPGALTGNALDERLLLWYLTSMRSRAQRPYYLNYYILDDYIVRISHFICMHTDPNR